MQAEHALQSRNVLHVGLAGRDGFCEVSARASEKVAAAGGTVEAGDDDWDDEWEEE